MTASTGRTAAPPNLRLLNGQGEGRDSGGREVAPAPAFRRGKPAKPDTLSADAGWLWDLIIDQWYDVDLLKPLDAASLTVACETYARWQEALRMRKAQGLTVINSQGESTAPWVGIEERAARDFRAWCAEYGLTPAAESKIHGGPDVGGEDNPFE
jgi:P27 family predicted phage terminase small subunit